MTETLPAAAASWTRRVGTALLDLLRRPRVVVVMTLSLLFAGLLLDMTTIQALVVAITFNIPIAVSGLANSHRLTLCTIVLALGANVVAAYENAAVFGVYDRTALINRGLAALSFLIVGAMTLLRREAVEEVEHLVEIRQAANREHALRRFSDDLDQSSGPDDLVERAAAALYELLEAEAVVIVSLHGQRFVDPRWTYGNAGDLARPGQLASWAVDAIPSTESPAITVRTERGLITTGRWRRADTDDMIVIVDRPHAAKPSIRLSEALHGLVPLLEEARLAASESNAPTR